MKQILLLLLAFSGAVLQAQVKDDIENHPLVKLFTDKFPESKQEACYRPCDEIEANYFSGLYRDDYLGDTLVVDGKMYFFSQSSMKQFDGYMFGKRDPRLVHEFLPKNGPRASRGHPDKGYVLHFNVDGEGMAYVDRATYNGYMYPDSMNNTAMDLAQIGKLTGSEVGQDNRLCATWLDGRYRINDVLAIPDQKYEGQRYIAVFRKGKLVEIQDDKEKSGYNPPLVDLRDKPEDMPISEYKPEYVYYKQADGTETKEKVSVAMRRLRKKIEKTYRLEPFLDRYCVESLKKMGLMK